LGEEIDLHGTNGEKVLKDPEKNAKRRGGLSTGDAIGSDSEGQKLWGKRRGLHPNPEGEREKKTPAYTNARKKKGWGKFCKYINYTPGTRTQTLKHRVIGQPSGVSNPVHWIKGIREKGGENHTNHL